MANWNNNSADHHKHKSYSSEVMIPHKLSEDASHSHHNSRKLSDIDKSDASTTVTTKK
jgi:hypothetical protein